MNSRTSIVIYYFDQPGLISEMVKGVIAACDLPILLVDDGSETPVSHCLYSFEVKQALESGRVRLVRFENHRGKGPAFQYALNDLIAGGFTHMLTMDGDGSHVSSEISKLLRASQRHPWDLIVGRRRSEKKWLTRRIESFLRLESGMQVQDVHSGFRVYPLFFLQQIQLSRWRYAEFELQSLIRLLWRGIRIQEIDVELGTSRAGRRPRFWAGTALNLWISTLVLLRTHDRADELALALGLGVFVGCTPLFGFHTLLAIALALVLRLNVLALWMGTHVSTPIFLPLVVGASVYIGKHWLGVAPTVGYMSDIYQWAAGSLVLGAGLGVIVAAVTYLMAREFHRRRLNSKRVNEATDRFVQRLVSRLGVSAVRHLLPALSMYIYVFHRSARVGLNEFYRLVQPSLSGWNRQRVILDHLRQGLSVLIESGPPRPATPSSDQNIYIGLHFGLPPSSAPQTLHLIDRPKATDFQLLPFFGRLAPFDLSFVERAIHEKRPIASAVLLKRFHQENQLLISKPRVASGSASQWIHGLLLNFEYQVRRDPAQWLNFYPFWSTLPVGAEGLVDSPKGISSKQELSRDLPDRA